MALAPAVQGAVGTSQEITWTDGTGIPTDLTGATLTGRLRNMTAGATKSITGALTIVNAPSGIFRWTYSSADLDSAGIFETQFTATYIPGVSVDRTIYETFYIHRELGNAFPRALLTPAGYNLVRAAIDITLTKDILPDEVIAMSIFHGAAELSVLERDPLAYTREGEDRSHVYNAIVYATAANLVPSIPFLIREDFGDYNYSRFLDKGHVERLVSSLRQRSSAELSVVLGADALGSFPPMFDVATGRRGA